MSFIIIHLRTVDHGDRAAPINTETEFDRNAIGPFYTKVDTLARINEEMKKTEAAAKATYAHKAIDFCRYNIFAQNGKMLTYMVDEGPDRSFFVTEKWEIFTLDSI